MVCSIFEQASDPGNKGQGSFRINPLPVTLFDKKYKSQFGSDIVNQVHIFSAVSLKGDDYKIESLKE